MFNTIHPFAQMKALQIIGCYDALFETIISYHGNTVFSIVLRVI
jgi:hypothetical protein